PRAGAEKVVSQGKLLPSENVAFLIRLWAGSGAAAGAPGAPAAAVADCAPPPCACFLQPLRPTAAAALVIESSESPRPRGLERRGSERRCALSPAPGAGDRYVESRLLIFHSFALLFPC